MSEYVDGRYLSKNPTWHTEDSEFKASQVHRLMSQQNIAPKSIVEIGCGTGAVLANVAGLVGDDSITYHGYDISAEAIEMGKSMKLARVSLENGDWFETGESADLLLVIDVFEHIEDYMGFLRKCRERAKHIIYHIPLDVHVSSVMRGKTTSARASVGHLHYFTAESALATLEDTGHTIVDAVYTPTAFHSVKHSPTFGLIAANVPRWMVSRFSNRMSARLFGGFSLLVYAQ